MNVPRWVSNSMSPMVQGLARWYTKLDRHVGFDSFQKTIFLIKDFNGLLNKTVYNYFSVL